MTTEPTTQTQLDVHLPLGEIARRFDWSDYTVRSLVKQGRLTVLAEDSSHSGRPAQLVSLRQAEEVFRAWSAERWERRSIVKKMQEEFDRDRELGIPLPGTKIGVREGAAKYDIDPTQLSRWVKAGEVTVLQEPTKPGGRRYLDENSLFWRKQSHARRQNNRSAPPGPPPRPSSGTPTPPLLRDDARRRPEQPLRTSRRRRRARGSWGEDQLAGARASKGRNVDHPVTLRFDRFGQAVLTVWCVECERRYELRLDAAVGDITFNAFFARDITPD